MKYSERTKRIYPWLMLACAVMMNFMFPGMIYNTLSVYTPTILAEFPEFSRASFILAVTLGNVVTGLGNLVYEPIHRKIGVRGMIMLGAATMLSGAVIYSFAASLPIFYLGNALMGYSIVTCASASTVLIVNNWFAKRSGALVSVGMAGTGIGVFVFSPIVAHWIETVNWRFAMRASCVVLLVLLVILLLLFRERPEDIGMERLWEDETTRQTARAEEEQAVRPSIYHNHEYRIIMVQSFIMGMLFFPVLTNMTVMASDIGSTTMQVGLISSIGYGANVLFQLPVGMSCDRFGSAKVLYVTLTIFIAAMAVLNMPGLTFPALACVAAYMGYCKVIVNNVTPFMVRETVPAADMAQMVSTCVGLMTLGLAVGGYMIQLGYDWYGSYVVSYWVYAGIALCSIFVVRRIFRGRKSEK